MIHAVLSAAFFVSGAAALIFENLWFREAGLVLGNSVWATSLVLAAFMAGLALGGGLVARFGHRAARLVRLYGLLELAVAATGLAAVLAIPHAGSPMLALLLVPTTAMGATLPLLVAALSKRESFGRVLGWLYGWNTLGAVAGVLGCELVLVPALGLRGSGCVAALLGACVGGVALVASRSIDERADEPEPATRSIRVLACAFGCGAALLALEVIWSRFLALYVIGTSLALALMLAVILVGIGLGGLVASRLLRVIENHLTQVAVLAAVATFGSYFLFRVDAEPGSSRWQDAIAYTLRLALPTSLVSGALFTLLGAVAKRELGAGARAAGMFVVWNTLGAMVGALAGGFVLLPGIGVDGALFVTCALYGLVAVCVPRVKTAARDYASFGVVALCLVAFPFGAMKAHVVDLLSQVTSDDAALVAYVEGRTGTLSVLEHRWEGKPVSYQLVTDGYSMSSTAYNARRYMKLFVYLPVALHPDPKRALLICFGVGQTAKALTDTASLEHIDVVDVSREILELDIQPITDPRVATHVEDGRHFLKLSTDRYDIITGEPPPPQVAGVVNLYSREYFDLVRDHLTEGGITTYWLPVHEMSVSAAQSISRAFCDAFPDCSLWNGFGLDWILVGTRGLAHGPSETAFAQQWSDPRVAPELRAIGMEHPEQLGALLMADAPALDKLIAGAPPLDDDHPARYDLGDRGYATFATWMNTTRAREVFAHSDLIARLFPPALRERTLPYFAIQHIINELPDVGSFEHADLAPRLAWVREIQRDTDLRTLVMLLFGYTAAHEAIMDTPATSPELELARGIRAIADRKFADADRHLATLVQTPNVQQLRAYANR